MAAYKGPLDYIDVASRIVEYREKYPHGVLTRVAPDGTVTPVEFIEFAGQSWVVYTAYAYRDPDDRHPGVGTAWEPTPGKTNFTKDSELQNAETAAWGRAMVAALAVDTKKGIASQEEVRNRQPQKPSDRVDAAVDAINACTDPVKLDEIETYAQKVGVAGVAKVKAALEAKRAELGPSGVDHWTTAEVPS